MRTTVLQAARQTQLHLRQAQARRAAATAQIASGLRVTKPSDSPADAAGVVRTQSALQALRQFKANLEAVQGEIRAVDGALSRTADVLTRALTLASQAANSTLDDSSRAAIRGEIEGVFRHLVSLANTRYSERFVFAGSRDRDLPFLIDPAAPAGVLFQGDDVKRAITFPDGRPAQFSLPGDSVFSLPDTFLGSGRTPDFSGASVPSPPLGIGVSFSGDVEAVISVDLDSFFVASSLAGTPAGGETVSVTFTSTDGAIVETITTSALAGGETTAQLAAALNTEIANNPRLAGGFVFSEEAGSLQLAQTDALGVGFNFTSTASGGLITGLETGGVTGGQSAAEIADALNTQVAADPALSAVGIRFTAVNGEVEVDGDVDFTFTAIDFSRGTGFTSGLAGTHPVGGIRSANVFGSLHSLIGNLDANDVDAILDDVENLRRAVAHIGRAQGFYGSTLRQVDITLEGIADLDVVNQQRLSSFRDADLVEAIADLQSSSTAEEFAIAVASRRQPNLLNLLA